VRITWFLSLVDLAVVIVVAVAIFVTVVPRPLYAAEAVKLEGDQPWALAIAEARALARPDDGGASAELSRRLAVAEALDWAVEVATQASERATPTRWRAMLAAAVAYGHLIDVEKAHEWAQRAHAACLAARDACSLEDEARVRLLLEYFTRVSRSGIDPRKDPKGFRRAIDQSLRPVHVQ